MCVRTTSRPALRSWPHRVTQQGPRLSSKAGRTESVLFFPSTWQPYFTALWPSPTLYPADKCSAPHKTCCLTLFSTAEPLDGPQPWPKVTVTNSKSSLFLTTMFSTYPGCSQFLSSNMHPWPQVAATSYFPDPGLLSRHWTVHVLVKLDPQTQTVNFCLAQNI